MRTHLPLATRTGLAERRLDRLEKAVAQLNNVIRCLPGPGGQRPRLDMDLKLSIIRSVAEHHGFHARRVISRSRAEPLARCRHMAIYVIRELTGATFQELGALFNRDHGAIIYACQAVADRIATEPLVKTEAEHWLNTFGQKDLQGVRSPHPNSKAVSTVANL